MEQALNETPHSANVIMLRSQGEIDALLGEIERARAASE
jgi:hypothetical protein